MEGQIFIDNSAIGIVNFKIIDESMGAIGGEFVATENYSNFKNEIQKLTDKNGNANSQNFNFRIILKNIELNPIGGICLIDSEEFGEMYLDAAGINQIELEKVSN
ncbi:hypothetical protein [Flavobacterium undicola]|uniref:hypothetical protein n=1 Tax=Flavobacterium undicola TaxID=1932779 RepID=UPI0013782335|nr:hypothetical protein [Flavobacterium undicola]MBA0884675.1 hypothetical protein [Flavobacterium undicola]